MSTRNPSDFTQWIDERDFLGGKQIRSSPIDSVLDDQQYVRDCSWLALSLSFWPFSTQSASDDVLPTHRFLAADECSVAVGGGGTMTVSAWGYCRRESTAVGVAGIKGTGPSTEASPGTSWGWVDLGTTTASTNGGVNNLLPYIRRDSGSGSIFIAGLRVYSVDR